MQSLLRRQVVFTVAVVGCGLLEVLVASLLTGMRGAQGATLAVVLCLVPGWVTIFASEFLRRRNLTPYAVLIGTGLRMMFVLAGALLVTTVRQDFGFFDFTIWLVVSYMAALAVETYVILSMTSSKVA